MGQISVSGTLQGGPPAGGDIFPSAQFITPLRLSQSPKGFQSASGILTRSLTDPNVFVVLTAVGPAADVPKANFVYIRAESDYKLRITQDDGLGGTVVRLVNVRGLFMSEFPDNQQVVLLEASGSTKLEYFASGPV
jgi:hypothetical protein